MALTQSLVLLSSGLDSTVNLYMERAFHSPSRVSLALTFDYGQKAAQKEVACAKKICEALQVQHKTLSLDFFKEPDLNQNCSLLNPEKKVPQLKKRQNLEDFVQDKSTRSVWVPNRNGLFIALAAAYAESLKINRILVGFNAEEAGLFPDNSVAFLKATNRSLVFSTANGVQVVSHTLEKNKKDILHLAKKLGVNLNWLWPCYLGEEKWCGQCESCKRFREAEREAQRETQREDPKGNSKGSSKRS